MSIESFKNVFERKFEELCELRDLKEAQLNDINVDQSSLLDEINEIEKRIRMLHFLYETEEN